MTSLRFLILGMILACFAQAEPQSVPTGLWKTVDDGTGMDKGVVRIYLSNGMLFGEVEQIFEQKKRKGLCEKCSDERRNKPVLGMTILRNAKASDDARIWEGGDILDPEKGEVYRLRLKLLEGGNELEVRGYFGPFYRNQRWLRIK